MILLWIDIMMGNIEDVLTKLQNLIRVMCLALLINLGIE